MLTEGRSSDRYWRWVFWGVVLALIALINCVDIWSLKCVRNWVFGQTGAAWVQSVGSIAAILAAFRLSRIQYENNLSAEAVKYRVIQDRTLRAIFGLYLPIQKQFDLRWDWLVKAASPEYKITHDDLWPMNNAILLFMFTQQSLKEIQTCLTEVDPVEYGHAAADIVRFKSAMDGLLEAVLEVQGVTQSPEVFPFPRFSGQVSRLLNSISWSAVCLNNMCKAVEMEVPDWMQLQLQRLAPGIAQSLK